MRVFAAGWRGTALIVGLALAPTTTPVGSVASGAAAGTQPLSAARAGAAASHDTVNLAALARDQARSPASPRVAAARRPLPRPERQVRAPGQSAASFPSATAKVMAPAPMSPVPSSPGTAISFDGLDDNGTATPPDTDGAVGPHHVVTALNTQIRILDRSGGAVRDGMGNIIGPIALSAFWGSLMPRPGEVSDPRVRYDPAANRWMLAATANPQSSSSAALIAVSQSSDPTGTWNRYQVAADSNGQSWADYTNLGFNSSWIVVTYNLFSVVTGLFVSDELLVWNKADLYAGGTGKLTVFTDRNGFAPVPASTYDPSASTMYLLELWDGSRQQLRLTTVTGSVGSEAYTSANSANITLSLGPWQDTTPLTNGGFAPQAGSAELIDTGDDRMQSVVYRGGSIWAAQTVFLPCCGPVTPAARSAVQWMQLTPSSPGSPLGAAVAQSGRIDDPNGDPITGNHRFYAYPSLAVNSGGDMAIGFARFSADQFGAAGYAFRAAADAAGSLRREGVLRPGLAPYVKTFGTGVNRWGDYSATVVDPVDDAGLWTIQEYASVASGGTDRWGTWWARLAGSDHPGSTTSADSDGDHRSDPTVFRPGNGSWYALNSAGSPPYTQTPWGQSGDLPAAADLLSQGFVQDTVYRPNTGTWYILRPAGTYTPTVWGQAGDVPVPADYDGSGRAQIAVFRPGTGQWFVRHADGTYTATAWGQAGDVPVPADYVGAGRAQIAVFRPGTGQWFVLHADGTYATTTWGRPGGGDVPIPADYDGRGRAQIAVFRSGSGEWFVLHSDGSYTDTVWGQNGDIPQPGDADGDGRGDLTVYRPSTGEWFTLPSSGGAYSDTVWGTSGDIPVWLPTAVRLAYYP